MYGPRPRHRRKAGSGPPADALIAWIGADPYLRNATVTANHRREIALPPPANSRTARAAVAGCFVLAFSAVLSITTLSDGLVVPRETPTLAPPSRNPVAVPRQPDPALIPGPSAVTPATLGDPPLGDPPLGDPPLGSPQPNPAPSRGAVADHPTGESSVPHGGSPGAGPISPPTPSGPPHRTGRDNGPALLRVPPQQQGTGEVGGGTPPLGSGGPDHPGTPAGPGPLEGPDPGESGPAPASPGPDHPHRGGSGEGTGISRGSASPPEHGSDHASGSTHTTGSTATPGARSGRR